jgi:hypothetical protein
MDGELGGLGQDGAFGDDGRFHPLSAGADPSGCGALDADGDTSFNVSLNAVDASGAAGDALGIEATGCGRPGAAACPRRDLRDVYYGALGRDAQSVSYEDADGRLRTVRTASPYGAYLIVRRSASADAAQGLSIGGGTGPGEVIRKVAFRDGRSCTFPKPGSAVSATPCDLPGVEPAAPRVTHAQLATRVRAHAYRRGGRYWAISVGFRARAAITTAGQAYAILLRNPNAKDGLSLIGLTRQDVAAGSVVTKRTAFPASSGVHTGEVRLVASATPGRYEPSPDDGVLVGRFEVDVP